MQKLNTPRKNIPDTVSPATRRKVADVAELLARVTCKIKPRCSHEGSADCRRQWPRLQRNGASRKRYQMLRKQLINAANNSPINFQTEPWASAALLTPCRAVRRLWNEVEARRACQVSGEQLFVCDAEDRIGGRKLILAERCSISIRAQTEKCCRHKDLPATIELAKAMKDLVTDNMNYQWRLR